ncbi:protein pxr-1-like [Nicotiana tomentosiformis]|uniref:protein pxr-1-like n=1 Tax=Nicotiana tomentosiformis TaxID=4098 RepID=UPI00388CDDD8
MVKFTDRCKYTVVGKHQGHSLYACQLIIRDEKIKRIKEEEVAEASESQINNQKKAKDDAGTSKNQKKTQGEKPKASAQDQNMQNSTEHQKTTSQQNAVTEISKDECQNQKKKDFKGTNQSKKHQQAYIPKQPSQQHAINPSTMQNKESSMTFVSHLVTPGVLE